MAAFNVNPTNNPAWFDQFQWGQPYGGAPTYREPVAGGPYSSGNSNDRIVRDQYAMSPFMLPNGVGDPNAGASQGYLMDPTGAVGGLQSAGGYGGSGGYGGYGDQYGMSPYSVPSWMSENPFGGMTEGLAAALAAMQEMLSDQQRRAAAEYQSQLAELQKLEDAKKKRRLLGAKGRSANILTSGSGITADAPVSRAVLY